LLDEPSQGLSPILVEQMFATIQRLARERDIGILLVEQSTTRTLNIAAYCYVMEGGQIALEGIAASLAGNPRIQALYLGA